MIFGAKKKYKTRDNKINLITSFVVVVVVDDVFVVVAVEKKKLSTKMCH